MKAPVYIVDDDPAVRDSLSELLSQAGYDVSCFATGEEFLQEYRRTEAGCAILDICLPETSGLDLQLRLQEEDAPLHCVFITGHGDIPMAVKAMRRGAVDFLEKPCPASELLAAVESGIEASRQRQERRAREQRRAQVLPTLTPAEKQVLDGVLRGRSNLEIARSIGVSLRTIQFRRASLMKKFGVRTRSELVDAAMGITLPAAETETCLDESA
ncbi:MAG: response regulator transcription factor [Pirellulaceae bacterium]